MISFRRSHRRNPLCYWLFDAQIDVALSSFQVGAYACGKKPLNQILFQILFHKRWYGCCHLQNFRFEAHDWYMLLKRLFNYFTFLDWINSLTSCREASVTCLAVWSLNWRRLASNDVLTLWSVRWWNRSAGGNLLDSNLCVTRCDEHVNLGLGHSRPVCNSCHSIRSTGLFFRMVQFFCFIFDATVHNKTVPDSGRLSSKVHGDVPRDTGISQSCNQLVHTDDEVSFAAPD